VVPLHLSHPMLLQVIEMLGNLYLRFLQHRLKVAYAKRGVRKQVQYSEPSLVAETLVDLNEFHWPNDIPAWEYSATGK